MRMNVHRDCQITQQSFMSVIARRSFVGACRTWAWRTQTVIRRQRQGGPGHHREFIGPGFRATSETHAVSALLAKTRIKYLRSRTALSKEATISIRLKSILTVIRRFAIKPSIKMSATPIVIARIRDIESGPMITGNVKIRKSKT